MAERYLMAKEIRDAWGIAAATLRQWEEGGLLHPTRTAGGHRRYSEKELLAILGPSGLPGKRGNRCALYARVALNGPAGERTLGEQRRRLQEEAARRQYVTVAEYWETASGLDENRKEMGRLLRSVAGGEMDLILVESRDRLAWVGFKYVDLFCRHHHVAIEEMEKLPQSREELIQEAGRLIEYLCSRLVGEPAPSLAGEVMAVLRSTLGGKLS